MKRGIHKNYFLGSLLAHLLIILMFAISNNSDLKRSFVVFGAHSKKTTKVFFTTSSKKMTLASRGNSGSGHGKKNVKQQAKNSSVKQVKKKPEPKKADKKHTKKNEIKEKKSKKPPVKKQKESKESLADIKEKSEGTEVAVGKKGKKKDIKNKEEKKEIEKKEQAQKKQKKKQQEELEEEHEEEVVEKKYEEKLLAERDEEEALFDDDIDDEDDELDDSGGQGPEEFNFFALSDKERAVYYKLIQQEVDRLWRPPLGVPRGTRSDVAFVLSEDGVIESFEFVKCSIVIFDASIQQVAMNFKFDKSFWGKKIVVNFVQ